MPPRIFDNPVNPAIAPDGAGPMVPATPLGPPTLGGRAGVMSPLGASNIGRLFIPGGSEHEVVYSEGDAKSEIVAPPPATSGPPGKRSDVNAIFADYGYDLRTADKDACDTFKPEAENWPGGPSRVINMEHFLTSGRLSEPSMRGGFSDNKEGIDIDSVVSGNTDIEPDRDDYGASKPDRD